MGLCERGIFGKKAGVQVVGKIFGLLVWISENARQPISRRCDSDGFSPNHNSYGVLPLIEDKVVKFVK